jgi:hypothetical protein
MRRSILFAATLLAAAMLGPAVELLDTRSLLARQLSRIAGNGVQHAGRGPGSRRPREGRLARREGRKDR